jgi:hypothetical protein
MTFDLARQCCTAHVHALRRVRLGRAVFQAQLIHAPQAAVQLCSICYRGFKLSVYLLMTWCFAMPVPLLGLQLHARCSCSISELQRCYNGVMFVAMAACLWL